jgi:hypothetical protein
MFFPHRHCEESCRPVGRLSGGRRDDEAISVRPPRDCPPASITSNPASKLRRFKAFLALTMAREGRPRYHPTVIARDAGGPPAVGRRPEAIDARADDRLLRRCKALLARTTGVVDPPQNRLTGDQLTVNGPTVSRISVNDERLYENDRERKREQVAEEREYLTQSPPRTLRESPNTISFAVSAFSA